MAEEGQSSENQSIEHAMQYLQDVEKELPEKDFADFLIIIEEFKSNRFFARFHCHAPSALFQPWNWR